MDILSAINSMIKFYFKKKIIFKKFKKNQDLIIKT